MKQGFDISSWLGESGWLSLDIYTVKLDPDGSFVRRLICGKGLLTYL